MTTPRNEQEILKSLDSALDDIKWKGPPSDISHLNSPEHLESFKKLGNQEQVTSERIIYHALQIEKRSGGALRICSIGCEDGSLDKFILQGLKDVTVQYVGLDSDELLVEEAKESLAGVSPNIEVHTVAVAIGRSFSVLTLSACQLSILNVYTCNP